MAELAKSLTDLGNDVHVISRRVRSEDPKTERVNGFTVHRVYRWILRPERRSSFTASPREVPRTTILSSVYYLYLLTVFRLYVAFVCWRVVSKHKLGLIIERETSFGAGAIASLFARKTLILEIIGPRYSRMSVERSKNIFYYTESMLRGWVDRAKCVPIPAGANLSLFRVDSKLGESQREKLHLEPDDVVIGYVGTFQEWHGIQDLLRALSSLRQKFPRLRALLVGPYYQPYESLSKSSGVSDICKFVGPIDYNDVPSYVNACDIMVALYNPNANSLRKKYGIGSPIKILEYMACGKPVISTQVEPINQMIEDGVDGILVSPGEPLEVQSCIEGLMLDPAKREKIAEKGKLLVESKYSWRAVALTMSSYF